MIRREKERHHKELIIELEDIELREEDIGKNESKYIVDYLYGISDIDKKINDYLLEFGLEDEWIVFYRCILRKKYLTKEYDKYRYVDKNIFLMRNEKDFEKWKEIVLAEKKLDTDIDKKVELTIEKILEDISEEKIARTDEIEDEFKKLLKIYFIHSHNKKSEKYELSIYNLDVFLKREYKFKNIFFNKTNFFANILKIDKVRISNIQKKYS